MSLKVSYRSLSIVFLGLNTLFVFANPDAYLGIADYYIFIVAFLLMCLMSRMCVKKDANTKIIFLIMGYNLFGILIALFYGVFSTGYILSYYMYLVLALFMYSMEYNAQELKKLVGWYVASGAIISLILLIQRYDYYGGGNVRHSIQFMSNTPIDPNFLAAFLVFPGVLAFAKTMYKFSLKNLLFFAITFVGVVYTASRGALLSLLIGILFVLFEVFHENNRIKLLIRIAIIGLIAGTIFFRYMPTSIVSRLINFASYNDSSNAKRLFDWASGWAAFKQSPIWGYGLQGEMSIIRRALGIGFISHNTYIAFLLQLGALGNIIPIYGLGKLVLSVKHSYTLLGALVSSLFASLFVSGEVALFFWLPIIYVIILSKYENTSNSFGEWI